MTMKCVSCGEAEMVRDTRDVLYTYKGQTTTIPNVSGEYCPACNESLHNAEESEYLNATMLAFNKEVNGATVNPAFISETRKKLKLDQREAAEIFGGGPNAFSRYENGKTRPPLALVQLFKLLDTHPDLINELRPKRPEPVAAPVAKSRLARRKGILANQNVPISLTDSN
jgi:HTH-type transcriptional regulator / antitoxin MqsA